MFLAPEKHQALKTCESWNMYWWEEEDSKTGNKWEMSLFDTDTFSGGVKQLCSVKRPFVVFALWHLNIWTAKS